MTDTEAQKLIDQVEKRLFGNKADNYLNYQVRYHLNEFKASGQYADVLQHYLSHKATYLHGKVFYCKGMIIDRNTFKKEFYARTNRNNEWKQVLRIAKKSML